MYQLLSILFKNLLQCLGQDRGEEIGDALKVEQKCFHYKSRDVYNVIKLKSDNLTQQ